MLENNLLRFTFPFLVRRVVSTAFVRVVRVSFHAERVCVAKLGPAMAPTFHGCGMAQLKRGVGRCAHGLANRVIM